MELVYLYIDGYRNLKNAEFNFTQDVRLRFDREKRELSITDSHCSLPKGFWGENIQSLSMIVGNNGAGKTSLMQYIIAVFGEMLGNRTMDGEGILVLGDGRMLYRYTKLKEAGEPVNMKWISGKYKKETLLSEENVERYLGATKLIYMTNALAQADYQRNYGHGNYRFNFVYDCSVGSVIASDAERDVNRGIRKKYSGFAELEMYFIYEQYKQIKFVFDKNQFQILRELREQGYPTPVPERLYIHLLMEDQLGFVFGNSIDTSNSWDLNKRFFSNNYQYMVNRFSQIRKPGNESAREAYPYEFLRYQLGRGAVWGAVRSLARILTDEENEEFISELSRWQREYSDERYAFPEILESIWECADHIISYWTEEKEEWKILKRCRTYYSEFLRFVKEEKLEDHFRIETVLNEKFESDLDRQELCFSIATEDADWFIRFIKKYRYICNPDYFLDFHWGLSSGESNLLSMFASLYYIFDADYTNSKNGDYRILNRWWKNKYVKCDSVILMIDEADLTYHPEWQREYIALLTAFLTRIYPTSCCQNIQVLLSTHSPLLLGDVPQQNVIYLKRDPESGYTQVDTSEHVGTFGQNIHLLFRDSFFLEHGTIGHFAQGKMNELLQKLNQIEYELKETENHPERRKKTADEYAAVLQEECRPYAELIAEPIIRRKVLMQINELLKRVSQSGESYSIRSMSDEELAQEISRLKEEQDRRKHDKDFII